ncbi:E3 ubiquitin-protein ligase TRIM35-like, partial [Anguilla rostrata]|uniref:E3 ubiquitin-protein ligase TRIM35-like n=1 Tax=Anguilla rostrata TaxID=7938 RepID=UPI0030CE7706
MEAKALIPEDELCCSVCCEIFKEPVLLKCSHSFCGVCVKQYWEEKSSRECPICRRKASVDGPPLNLALRSIVEFFLKQKTERETTDNSDARCSLHGEKLLLFCEHDKEPLCVVCQTSKKHRNHPVCPVEEAVLELKDELKPALNLIKEKLKRFTEVEQECKNTAEHIKSQAQHTERQIKAEFEKLHQFLREEEEVRLAALREEEEQKSRIMKEKIENITGHISNLTDKITAIEKAMDTEDTSFLQSYKNIKERAQCTLQDPELLSGALIDVAKHLGNLKFRVWEKMLEMGQY